jgi:hypothetical protein
MIGPFVFGNCAFDLHEGVGLTSVAALLFVVYSVLSG